ncbi:unnamed protein product [Paramecium sonneborni]|uniref:Uncharacterized protein n=1 Tax=Paramecium sonneborni TaxID=65129 RepID=A0A8S1R6G5_9CILI|nr:unnamed protein product [Paramecium sonneborni]
MLYFKSEYIYLLGVKINILLYRMQYKSKKISSYKLYLLDISKSAFQPFTKGVSYSEEQQISIILIQYYNFLIIRKINQYNTLIYSCVYKRQKNKQLNKIKPKIMRKRHCGDIEGEFLYSFMWSHSCGDDATLRLWSNFQRKQILFNRTNTR